jgi:hypothetical protein
VSALKICPTCSTQYPANERFCPRDGTALRSQGGGTDLVGSILAERYHVLKKLGEGGMGQVYLAEHVKMGRRSAVKVMHPAMVNDADAIGRFNREAANASRINHPNVAGIYDFGETNDGLVYLAMEFIEGETLTELLKANGALPPQRAAEIARQTAEALNVAHEMGIVHRDLKPDNIMITKDHDGNDCVKVVDFGIAKAAGSEAQNVTRTGMVVGTPEYMSPEQLSGDKLDGRSDLYSLGLVTFNMLTGKLPFPSDTTQSAMIMRLTDRPRPLAFMKGDVTWPAELQAVMDRVLERDASLRYPKARDFGRALVEAARLVATRPSTADGTKIMESVQAPPAPPIGAAARRSAPASPRTRRTAMIVGGVVVAAALAAGAFFMTRPSSTSTAGTAATVAAAGTPAAEGMPAAEASGPGPGTGTAPVPAPTPPPAAPARLSAADSAALAKELQTALAHASNESTARRALKEADGLAPRVTVAEDQVMVEMVRAQAYGTLGQDKRSCDALRDGVAKSKGTMYETQLSGMLARCQ